MIRGNPHVVDIAGLREQIKANVAVLAPLQPPCKTHIVVAKPAGSTEFTAWVLLGNTKAPMTRGSGAPLVEKALELLLEKTAQLVAEEFARAFEAFDDESSDAVAEDDVDVVERRVSDEEFNDDIDIEAEARKFEERYGRSGGGWGYQTMDGSGTGYGPGEVQYRVG